MFFYRDRSMSIEQTLIYFAVAIGIIAASQLFIGNWSILLGVLWLLGRLFSPNIMERAMGFALLVVLAVRVAMTW